MAGRGIIILSLLMLACCGDGRGQYSDAGQSDRKIIDFGSNLRLETDLFEVAYIGRLQAKSKSPYIVLSGKGCTQCDMNTSIYIHSPSDGPLVGGEMAPRYSYPGRVFYYEDNSLVEESRLFLGECLTGLGPVAAWFTKSKNDAGEWEESLFAAEVRGDSLARRTLGVPGPYIAQVNAAVAEGRCREVPGRDMLSEP